MSARSPYDIPISTYRLQFSRDFTFDDARAIVPYLAHLGISHVYASPFLKARTGSTHGYDIVDHNQINPEIGTRESFERFCAELRIHGMGLILDFVPNHVGIGHEENAWWQDVLEWGQASPYAAYFDIDWAPLRPGLTGKILLPILMEPYGAALTHGAISLEFDAHKGALGFRYDDHFLPLAPTDYSLVVGPVLSQLEACEETPLRAAMETLRECPLYRVAGSQVREAASAVKASLARAAARDSAVSGALDHWHGRVGDSESFVPLHDLLERQTYRLADWRTASDEINYRRFFDISDLAAIRTEEPAVFHATHQLVGQLFEHGHLHGVRLDHVDGLADPRAYCRKLNEFLSSRIPSPGDASHRPYILVEKIMAHHERLRSEWPVMGTTGYDFLAYVNGLFVDPAGVSRLERGWKRFSEASMSFADEAHRCKRFVIDNILASELATLTNLLIQIAEADWYTRDFTRQRLRAALAEIASEFPVYRTYVAEGNVQEADLRDLKWAVEHARERWVGTDLAIFDFIHSLLSLDIAQFSPAHFRACKDPVLRFVARFQQFTSAVAAKAVEDTLFYRRLHLVSLNEVGSDLRHSTISAEAFHRAGIERSRYRPYAMLTTETHDTKRSEDVRARLNLLSEFPREWERQALRWRLLNRTKRIEQDDSVIPTPGDEYLLYQTILGSWPVEINGMTAARNRLGEYVERLKAYALKASREAKLVTSWISPDNRYEAGFMAFIEGILGYSPQNPFLKSILRFVPRFVHQGTWSSLAQLVLKSTMPGVPDFYQGSELWDLHLVDPDNRRPVDFPLRLKLMTQLEEANFAIVKDDWRDGRLKFLVTRAALQLRRELPELFRDGFYEPLETDGKAADCALAYRRRLADAEVVVCVARLIAGRYPSDHQSYWCGGPLFEGSSVLGVGNDRYREVFSGAQVYARDGRLPLDLAFQALPVAMLRPL